MAESTAIEIQKPGALEFSEQNVSMVQQLAQAQIQSAYIWAAAPQNKRDFDVIEQQVLKECRRPQFVAVDPDPKKYGSSNAMYGVPRGGQFVNGNWVPNIVTGLTIRFAEMVLPFLKSIAIDLWPIGEDDEQCVFRAVRIDYESNVTESEIIRVPKTVERRKIKETDYVLSTRTNSDGKSVYIIHATNEEIDQTKRALYAKAKRNLVLSIIPGWLRKAAEEEIRATQRKVDAQDPDAARKRLYAGFAIVGVGVEDIKKYIGHANELSPAELEDLRVLYAGIAEGITTWKEILAAKEEAGEGGEELDKRIAELFEELQMPPAQIRNTKARHLSQPKKLIEYLEGLVAKKRNDGSGKKEPSAKDPTIPSTGTTTTQANTTSPATTTENPDAEPPENLFTEQTTKPGPVAVDKPKSKPAPPPVDTENWS